jgi:hypothetical protein
MTGFTTRVELHDANWSDYEKLHVEMRRRGFYRTITGDNDVTYDLPPAEYVCYGTLTKWEVLEKAKAAAAAIKPKYSVLVTEAASWAWFNLKATSKAVA